MRETPPRRTLLAILALALLLRAIPLLRPIGVLDSWTLPDDTWICLSIARSIGRGAGPSVAGRPTNGVQPLYVLLAAPLFSGLDDDEAADPVVLDRVAKRALWIPVLADLAALWVFAHLVAKRMGARTALWVALLHACHPWTNSTALNGMETSIALLMLLSCWWAWDRLQEKASAARAVLLGGLLGLGMLARIDLGVLGPVMVGLDLWRRRRERGQMARIALWGLVAVVAAGVQLPWLLWQNSYTGLWFPVSGRAVRFQSLAQRHRWLGLTFWLRSMGGGLGSAFISAPVLWLGVGAGLLWPWGDASEWITRARRRLKLALQQTPLLLTYGTVLYFAYTLGILGWWFYHRYLFPLVLIALLGGGALLAGWERARARPLRWWQAVLLVLAFTLPHPKLHGALLGPDRNRGYRPLGLWALERFPPGTKVASSQSGGLGYYAAGLDVYNLDGVVDPTALEKLQERDVLGWMRDEGVRYMVGWRINDEFVIRHSDPEDVRRLRRVETLEEPETWGFSWRVSELR